MALVPYRPNEGRYSRIVAAAGLLLLDLFASVRLFQTTVTEGTFALLAMPVRYSTIWAAVFFLIAGVVIAVFTFGLRTGIRSLDAVTASFVDMLVDTEAELQKVSWPTKDDLTTSTSVVLVCVVILGIFLWCVDLVVSFLMSSANVLPR